MKKIIIRVLSAIFAVAVIFYALLFWKVSSVPSSQLSFGQKVKIIFTWNPAEILFSLNHKWDSSAGNDQQVMPASNFSDLKTVIEKSTEQPIFFSILGETIVFDETGKAIVNRGTFIREDGRTYKDYDYEIYLNATKAVKSYETDHQAGMTITKKPGSVSGSDLERAKVFTAAALSAEKEIDWSNTKGKNALKFSVSGLIINQFQFSYGDSKEVDKNLLFDQSGKITQDPKGEPDKTVIAPAAVSVPTSAPDLSLIDSDNDGLSDSNEAKYGTDPHNPDTDGDGYKDGEEVKAGFNPLGAGNLPAPASTNK